MHSFIFQTRQREQKEEEKKQLLEKRELFKKTIEEKRLLVFDAAEMAAKERAANKAKKQVQ